MEIQKLYIGKSGTIKQNGNFKVQSLKARINNKQENMKRQDYFNKKFESEQIDALEIYWFVTMDDHRNDLPGYVEGLIMQQFFNMNGKLPLWNKEF